LSNNGNKPSGQPWPAPAKLNLFLHVVGRRDDGYHLLQTVFQFIDWCDDLYFELRSDRRLCRSSRLAGVAEEDDLVVRAARALRDSAAVDSLGVNIYVDKRLPMGGGLGGGSSNAATTLVALNQLWGLNFSLQRLAEIGLALGADVPVFIHGYAAWAEGVGERLTRINPEEPWYLVVVPACSISTAEIFSAPELTRDSKIVKIRGFIASAGRNDCEPVVCARYPDVAEALEWLSQYAPARMSGSGASVFSAFDTESAAQRALQQLPEKWQGTVVKGINRSPLCERAGYA